MRVIVGAFVSIVLLSNGVSLAAQKLVLTSMGGDVEVYDAGNHSKISEFLIRENFIRSPVVHPSGSSLYVTSTQYVHFLNLETGLNYPIYSRYFGSFGLLMLDPTGQHLYVFSMEPSYGFGALAILETSTQTQIKYVPITPIAQAGLSADGTLYSTEAITENGNSGVVFRKRKALTLELIAETPLAPELGELFVRHPRPMPVVGDYAYAISDETGVTPINIATMAVQPRVEVDANIIQIVVGDETVFVLDDVNTIHIYNALDMALLNSVSFDFIPFSLAYDHIHNAVRIMGLYDLDHSNGVIAAISATSHQLIHIEEALSFPSGMALQSAPEVATSLGMQVQGVDASIVKCINDTSGQIVYIPHQAGEMAWNCEQHGLQVSQGDTVTIGAKGSVPPPASGVVTGLGMWVRRMDVSLVQCLNDTTDQVITITPQPEQVMWDCEQYGLHVNVGESVTIKANGIVR